MKAQFLLKQLVSIYPVEATLKYYLLSQEDMPFTLDLESAISFQVLERARSWLGRKQVVGADTKIGDNVSLQGPFWIGDRVEIGAGAVIRPGSIIGSGCIVGARAEIKNSVCYPGAKIQSGAFLGDSIVGTRARIASGAVIANRRFDQGEIILKTDQKSWGSGSAFFGIVLGDNARIGANTVTMPGTLVGPYAQVEPLVQLRGFVPRGMSVRKKEALQLVEIKKEQELS
jgi:NDP-sugar pyrophosphorylase family protein